MAPDRGESFDYQTTPPSTSRRDEDSGSMEVLRRRRSDARRFIASHASEGQNFTLRGILVGLGVGLVICFSNMYFGLQTGWISSMSMPASLIGFAFFKSLSKHLDLPFTPVENVLVQSVAGSMGTMPLGCGLVGVMPALNYMLKPDEQGPIVLSLWKLILWSLGLCFFGVVFAVPLRRQVIIREKLKFPSGTATALMISVLHGQEATADGPISRTTSRDPSSQDSRFQPYTDIDERSTDEEEPSKSQASTWQSRVKLLVLSFAFSGIYTLATYFCPILRKLPVFGYTLAESWLWTLNPSLAYVGQGIIMGPATYNAYASWGNRGVGNPIPISQEEGMGSWPRV